MNFNSAEKQGHFYSGITQGHYYWSDSAICFTETILFTIFSSRNPYGYLMSNIKNFFAERFFRVYAVIHSGVGIL